jgi:acetolactate synthase regulatory subunit
MTSKRTYPFHYRITATNSENNLHRLLLVFKRKKIAAQAISMQMLDEDMIVNITAISTSDDCVLIEQQLLKIIDVINVDFV